MNATAWLARAGICIGTATAAGLASGAVSVVLAATARGEAWYLLPAIYLGPPAAAVSAAVTAALVIASTRQRPSAWRVWALAGGLSCALVAGTLYATGGALLWPGLMELVSSAAVGGLPPALLALAQPGRRR